MKMSFHLIAAAAAGILAFATAAEAAPQKVVVEKNHVARVTLSAPAGSVIVGNPDIADVSVVDSRTIYVIGKGFGNSSINVTGTDGRSLFDGEVTVTAVQNGAITVYKGLKPSLMVCSNICISEDPNANSGNVAPPSGLPASMSAIGPAAGQGAGAVGSTYGAVSGTAMQAQ